MEHLSPGHTLAAGLRSLPETENAFASVQAAWRFYQNSSVTLPHLAEPLLERARHAVGESCDHFVLLVHDWSQLHYNDHDAKQERVALSQSTDRGYELQATIALSDRGGEPLAPVYHGLLAADGVHSTLSSEPETPHSQLDRLAPVMTTIARWGWSKPAVHILDREADSIAHLRYWHGRGHAFLVRANDRGRAQHKGRQRSLRDIAVGLRRGKAFQQTKEVEYRGRKVEQWVAETTVTITRPAKLQRQGRKGPRWKVSGKPLSLRLVVVELREKSGKCICCWLLLTNVPGRVDTATIALWYYWRWRIESYFKLLKSAGQQLESWQQETPSALAKRLLVAAMACVLVWQLAQSEHPQAARVRRLLIRLSGRQMKRGHAFTMPALLAGLWVYLHLRRAADDPAFAELKQLVPVIFAGDPPGNTS
jgi:hypothetical protein